VAPRFDRFSAHRGTPPSTARTRTEVLVMRLRATRVRSIRHLLSPAQAVVTLRRCPPVAGCGHAHAGGSPTRPRNSRAASWLSVSPGPVRCGRSARSILGADLRQAAFPGHDPGGAVLDRIGSSWRAPPTSERLARADYPEGAILSIDAAMQRSWCRPASRRGRPGHRRGGSCSTRRRARVHQSRVQPQRGDRGLAARQ
jgi:hypothetical protein